MSITFPPETEIRIAVLGNAEIEAVRVEIGIRSKKPADMLLEHWEAEVLRFTCERHGWKLNGETDPVFEIREL